MNTLTDPVQVQEWKDYMREYASTRKALAYKPEVPHVHTHKEIKQKEYMFDTVMAKYRDPRQEEAAKGSEERPMDFKRKNVKDFLDSTAQGFDIITLEQQRANLLPPEDKLARKRILPKAQVVYNILTNGEHPEYHWKNAEKPEAKKEYKRSIHSDIFRDFNIISNKYWENHDDKDNRDRNVVKQHIDDKYKKTHEFNHLTCSYYDQNQEQAYQADRKEKQLGHGKEYINRLPPTLRVRETVVFDESKPVPEEVKRFDERRKNQKKRYEKRYELEEEYRDVDIANQDRAETMALNRYHGDKYYEEKKKGWDNFTLEKTNQQVDYLQAHTRNKPKLGVWEQIQQSAEERAPERKGTTMIVDKEPPQNRLVDVDQLPLYSREPQLSSDQNAGYDQAPAVIPNENYNNPNAYGGSQNAQYDTEQGRIPETMNNPYGNPTEGLQQSPNSYQDQNLAGNISPSQQLFESLPAYQPQGNTNGSTGVRAQGGEAASTTSSRKRMYDPELAKNQNLYRQQETVNLAATAPNPYEPPMYNPGYGTGYGGGSLANGFGGAANRSRSGTMSRAQSGISNNSRLSFASDKSGGSVNKLPAINNPTAQVSNAQIRRAPSKGPLMETGGFN